MERHDLIVEIGLEEMPALFLPGALAQLGELAANALAEARLDFRELKTYGAPRRLALYGVGVAARQGDLFLKVRGPALKAAYDESGAPTRALEGFARGQGVPLSSLTRGEVKGVPYVYADKIEEGQEAGAVLPGLLAACLGKLSFPKSMRWGGGEFRFARPVRWLLALYDGRVLPLEFGGCQAGESTRGHRFLADRPIPLAEPGQYLAKLEEAWVLVDQDRRREIIRRQVTELAAAQGGRVRENPALLEEVTYLVEYPTAFFGRIEDKYMDLPPEVLITSMEANQRYFPVHSATGALLPGFIALRDGGTEHLDTVRAGNEKVLRARLEDAAFFWTEDQKTTLAARRPALDRVVFLEGLGSMGDKSKRLVDLTGWLGQHLGLDNWIGARAQRAASLAKSDLVTLLVNEFPELQGVVGGKIALAAGEEEKVAQAIGEHYLPRHGGDALPASPEGALVALADKTDNITGCFLAGLIPSGSQDPYALRRQAQAVVNIILEKELPLSLTPFINESHRLYQEQFPLAKNSVVLLAEVLDFFGQRLRFSLSEGGISYDVIDAVLAAGFDQPREVVKRARALRAFRGEADFAALLTAYTRAANLAGKGGGQPLRQELLVEPAEQDLLLGIGRARQDIAAAGGDYANAFRALAQLRPRVDAFFDAVLVMDPDLEIRAARLALLTGVVALLDGIADLAKIVE